MDNLPRTEFETDMLTLFDAVCTIGHFTDKYYSLLFNIGLRGAASNADRYATHIWAVLHTAMEAGQIITGEVNS